MINAFLRLKTKKIDSRALDLSEIQQANKVLFALFTRYGDTIIDLVAIREFIEQYPNKDYLILCPRQMEPYVKELLPEVHCIALNKRNFLDMFRIDRHLKKWRPDVGFNPWSNGLDSCYFLTYCQRFQCYKDFDKPGAINHYDVVRRFLQLPEKAWKIEKLDRGAIFKNVLVCPDSTDPNRSIPQNEMDDLVLRIKELSPGVKITIATLDVDFFRPGLTDFSFRKSAKSSQEFISLVNSSDLVVCSDSGPLHIAAALNKPIIAFFYSTDPKHVVNAQTKICFQKCLDF